MVPSIGSAAGASILANQAGARQTGAMSKKKKSEKSESAQLAPQLQIPQGPVVMGALDTRATPGYPGKGKKDAPELTAAMAPELSDLQERLYANGRSNPKKAPSVLLILQGMDTSGKGGVIRHAVGMVDPQGVQLKAFKAPTAEERRHNYLWRIRRELPDPGIIGVFDRSHYEDVLVARVDKLVPATTWRKRFDEINRFEQKLVDSGTAVIKCFLNVSADEQKERLAERLDNPEKYWKYNPGDLAARANWDSYQGAYADVLEKCNTDAAPWHVIPSDRKWYRNWAVARLLLEQLRDLDLTWPKAKGFNVAAQQRKLAKS